MKRLLALFLDLPVSINTEQKKNFGVIITRVHQKPFGLTIPLIRFTPSPAQL